MDDTTSPPLMLAKGKYSGMHIVCPSCKKGVCDPIAVTFYLKDYTHVVRVSEFMFRKQELHTVLTKPKDRVRTGCIEMAFGCRSCERISTLRMVDEGLHASSGSYMFWDLKEIWPNAYVEGKAS